MIHPKAARISPDSRPIAYGAASLASAIYLGAFATSFFGQASLAAHMHIPHQLQYVVPAVIDLGLVLFALATLVRKSRGESTVLTNLAIGFWTLISIIANIAHVLIPTGPQGSPWSPGTFAGAVLSALMPLAALGASLVIENVLIDRPAPEAATVEEAVEVTEPAATPKRIATPAPGSVRAELKGPVHIASPFPGPVKPQRRAVKPTAATADSRRAPAPVQAPQSAVAAASVPASPAVQDGQPVGGSKVGWESLSKSERADLVESMRADRLSYPEISKQLGVSLSTIKRVKADNGANQLQPA